MKLLAVLTSFLVFATGWQPAKSQQLIINEFLAANATTNLDQDGQASDWIEFFNSGSDAISLAGFALSDDPAVPQRWVFPEISIAPQSYLLVWASGKDRRAGELHANFGLSQTGESLAIYDTSGVVLDAVTFGSQQNDISMARVSTSAAFQFTTTPTPGATNVVTEPENLPPQIVINEFMASNGATIDDEDGESSDWLELFNAGTDTVQLAGLALTDDKNEPGLWPLPDLALEPESYLLIWASGKNRRAAELHTNFRLAGGGEFVGLYTADGWLVDGKDFGAQSRDIALARIPDGAGAFERTADPTPGATNRRKIPPGDALSFSPKSGFFETAVQVVLSSKVANITIRFTTDGSEVTKNSERYTDAIDLSSTKVIRARAFDGDAAVSDDLSQIYLIGYEGQLPVLSLATDDKNLNGGQGIFSNPNETGRSWERPVSVNFVEPNGSGFQINAGVRVHGAHSRGYLKKSMRLYFRSDYGESKLRYKLFRQKNIGEFDRIVVHSGGSFDQYGSGENRWTLLRDPLNHTLLGELGGNVSAHKPVIVYLNGEVWGIYMLREHIHDLDYLTQNLGVQDADLLEWAFNETPIVKEGDLTAWRDLHTYFKTEDIDKPEDWLRAQEFIDMENFIDYHILQIYGGHKDWPHNNHFFFRPRTPAAKWQWILWDSETTYLKHRMKGLVWATRDTVATDISAGDSERQLFGTIFMRRLVENEDFKRMFVSRFADLLNTKLHRDSLAATFDRLVAEIEPDIQVETDRWEGARMTDWRAGVAQVHDFIRRRRDQQWTQLEVFFRLRQIYNLTVTSETGGGQIRVNTLTHSSLPWSGDYFDKMPVEVEAMPSSGFEFSHWSGASASSNAEIELDLDRDETLAAHFVPVQLLQPEILSFAPDSGRAGIPVAIHGRHFQDVTAVSLTDSALAFTIVSDTLITTTVPENGATGKFALQAPGGRAESNRDFVVVPESPASSTIDGFNPKAGMPGATVTISGKGLGESRSVLFNGSPALILESSADAVRAKVPFGASSGRIAAVTPQDSVVSDSSFTVLPDTAGFRFMVAEDSYLSQSEPDANFGAAAILLSSSNHLSLLKFDLSGLRFPIKKVRLRLCMVGGSGGVTTSVHSAASDWQENTVNSAQPPFVDSAPLKQIETETVGEFVEWDLSGSISLPGTYSFAIRAVADDTISFSSREGFYPAHVLVEVDSVVSDIDEVGNTALPTGFSLSPAYPNPFNATTIIEYALPQSARVSLRIYNLVGQVVKTLVDGMETAGFKRVHWRGRDDRNIDVGSGVYFVRLVTGQRIITRKVLFQK